jgi:class 3 adenylate cyclase
MAPPQIRYARNGDVHIAYCIFGDGPIDLLYVPISFSVTEYLWEHPALGRFLARLGSFARVITFDRRESGMSDRLGRPPTLEEQMDDVIAVLDAAGSERAAVYAMLEGGPMAMMFAATHPERVGALVLYASFARTTRAPGYEWAWPEEERAARQAALHDNWGDGSLIEGMAPSYAGDRRLRDWMGSMQRYSMGPTAARALGDLNAQLDVRPVLPSIRVPTLVMHRRDDRGISVKHSEYLAGAIPGARLQVFEGQDNLVFLGDSEAVLDEIEEFLTGARSDRDRDRVLATVLLSDICGSTQRAASMGDSAWRDLLREHHESAARAVAAFQGRLIKSTGDGILATFDGPARGIRCARCIAEQVRELGIEIRAGLHTGELEAMNGDVGGMAVNIGARVSALAGAGEVLVSGTVRDLVVGSGIEFADRGEHPLKGVPGEWRLYAVEGG